MLQSCPAVRKIVILVCLKKKTTKSKFSTIHNRLNITYLSVTRRSTLGFLGFRFIISDSACSYAKLMAGIKSVPKSMQTKINSC